MSGIIGFSESFNSTLLDRMNAVISPQGSNDSGIYYDDSKGGGFGPSPPFYY